MSKDSFASRLASGTADVPNLVSWWPRHGSALKAYMKARFSVARDEETEKERQGLVGLSSEWEREVPETARRRAGSSLGLMCEHAVLEVALVDAAFESDPEAIERAGVKLMDNAAAHAGRYAKAQKDFPKGKFEALMKEHISIVIGTVQALLDNDGKSFEKYEKRRDANIASMAAFTAEWF